MAGGGEVRVLEEPSIYEELYSTQTFMFWVLSEKDIMKFKVGGIIKCEGEHFAEREILKDPTNNPYKYLTKFLEDNSVVESDAGIIDDNYWLKEDIGKESL